MILRAVKFPSSTNLLSHAAAHVLGEAHQHILSQGFSKEKLALFQGFLMFSVPRRGSNCQMRSFSNFFVASRAPLGPGVFTFGHAAVTSNLEVREPPAF